MNTLRDGAPDPRRISRHRRAVDVFVVRREIPTGDWERQDRQSSAGLGWARRRRAVEAFMVRHGLRPADWARMAGLSTANSLYNFLNAHSKSLGQDTLERLAKAVPGATVTEIIGETPTTSLKAATLQIRIAAGAGVWRGSYEVAVDPPMHMALPPGTHIDEAVIVLDRHADQVYPPGSHVGAQAVASLPRPLRSGDMVLVHRVRAHRHEVTLREIVVEGAAGEETARLAFRSSAEVCRISVGMPWPYRGEVWEADGDVFQVRARAALMVLVNDQDC